MASFSATISLLLLLVLSISSPSVHGSIHVIECDTLMTHMVGCFSFVRIGSTVDKPAGFCCNGLKTVLNTKADCLCDVMKSRGFMGINLDVTRTATLPVACNVTPPPVVLACGLSAPSPPASSTPSPPASSPVSPPVATPSI